MRETDPSPPHKNKKNLPRPAPESSVKRMGRVKQVHVILYLRQYFLINTYLNFPKLPTVFTVFSVGGVLKKLI
jgi:hypothetical protein